MTRILTIIALLFATPAWANSATPSQPDPAAYATQVNERLQKTEEVEKNITIGILVILLIMAILLAIAGIRQPHHKKPEKRGYLDYSDNTYFFDGGGGDGGGGDGGGGD
jgi:hypothetical protein